MYKRIDPNENVYIIKSFREDPKTSSMIYKKLGKLPDFMKTYGYSRAEALDWIDSQVRLCEREDHQESSPVPVTLHKNQRIAPDVGNLVPTGPFFIARTTASIGLLLICQNIQEERHLPFQPGPITTDLVIQQIFDPASKGGALMTGKQSVSNRRTAEHLTGNEPHPASGWRVYTGIPANGTDG